MNDQDYERKYAETMIKQQDRELRKEMEAELKALRKLTQYKRPSVTATIIIKDLSTGKYLLIKRRDDPFKDHYCFPGGFLKVDKETINQTAIRECQEETCIRLEEKDIFPIDVRSRPDRDPREHVIDHGFYTESFHAAEKATANDDAAEIIWVTEESIDTMEVLAFDHGELWSNFKNSRRYVSDITLNINQ